MGWLKRFRHGRGFGVHSPFAFRFITEVLRGKYEYYDFSRLDSSQQRLIYRIACYFYPSRVFSARDDLYATVVMACPNAQPSSAAEADLLIFDKSATTGDILPYLKPHKVIILTGRHRKVMPAIKRVLSGDEMGMVFDNERSLAVVVCNPKLPYQYFSAKF